MVKRSLLVLIISFTALFSYDKESAIEAVKMNPSLLNNPQVKQELDKRGLSKEEILEKLDKNSSKKIDSEEEIKNELVIEQINTEIKKEDKAEVDREYNPFKYNDNKEIVDNIRKEQIKVENNELKRFGLEFFRNKNKISPKTIPVPNDYVISNGDSINIWIYGTKNEKYELKVNSSGNINFPSFGPIKVKGLFFEDLSEIIQSRLKESYKTSNFLINVSSFSSMQVSLVGDIKAPGIYNVPALSTIKDLLIIAEGTTENGSIRNVIVKRDNKIVKILDFYDLLTNKNNNNFDFFLKNGDIVFIPKAKSLIKLSGEVKKEAIYELKNNETLEDLLFYSGGLKVSANKLLIKLERFENNELKVIDLPFNNKEFKLKDGDIITAYPLSEIDRNSFKVLGNIAKPGNWQIPQDKKLSTILEKIANNNLDKFFLENTLFSYALIKRIKDDLSYEVKSINLSKIINKEEDFLLKEKDELYIFNKLDTKLNPYVSIVGSPVISEGKFQFYSGMTLKDLISIAGIKKRYDFNNIKITTYETEDLVPKVIILTSKDLNSYKLSEFDEVQLFDYYALNPVKKVIISGEVNLPDEYIIAKDMTIEDLIKSAGGLTNRAYLKSLEVVRYSVVNDERIKKVIALDLTTNDKLFKLKNYDEIRVNKIPKWNERKTIELKGQIKFPGIYVIETGDKLVDIIKRAGGFTNSAFLKGAMFTRESIKKLQRQKLRESLLQLKQKAISYGSVPSKDGKTSTANIAELIAAIDALSKEAEELQPVGRITISLDKNMNKFENSPSNLVLKDKDVLYIPSTNDTVLVMGEVMSPTAIIYEEGTVDDYINKAGGLTYRADEDFIYIVSANGQARKYETSLLFGSDDEIKRGDTIVVPQELITYNGIQFSKEVSSIVYQFAVTAASLKTIGLF